MILVHPWALSLLLAAAAACVAAVGFQKWKAILPFSAEPRLWTEALGLRARLGSWAPTTARTAALILIAFALARPQTLSSRLKGLGQGIDIMLAVDSSLSMSAIDLSPNRIGAAKETAIRFVEGRVQDRIGLVTFGGAPELLCPLTADYDPLISQIKSLYPGITHADGTAIGDGIVSALNHLKSGSAKNKIIILLTDGRSNTGVIDPVTAAKAAQALGVKIYTIGTAKRGPALMPVDDPLRGRVMARIDDDIDDDLLTQIAQITGGEYFRATSLKQLTQVYRTIDRLQKSALKLPPSVTRRDLYRIPVLAAALLILAEIVLSSTWLLKWP